MSNRQESGDQNTFYGVGAMFVLECGSVFLWKAILGRFFGKVVMLRERSNLRKATYKAAKAPPRQ